VSRSLALVRHLLFLASVLLVVLCLGPVFAHVAVAAPIAPGPFGGDDTQAQPTVDLSANTGASSAVPDAATSSDATDASDVSASTDAGPAANPPDPSPEIAPAISVLDASDTPAVGDTSSQSVAPDAAASIPPLPAPGVEPGPLPLPGPCCRPATRWARFARATDRHTDGSRERQCSNQCKSRSVYGDHACCYRSAEYCADPNSGPDTGEHPAVAEESLIAGSLVTAYPLYLDGVLSTSRGRGQRLGQAVAPLVH
jgi:hypothetical protein